MLATSIAVSRWANLRRPYHERVGSRPERLAATTIATHLMISNLSRVRADLERLRIDHLELTDIEVFHLGCVLRGWHVKPRTAENTRAINATVWLAAALGTGGRYLAPETPGHPADLQDGGLLVDSVILMAVVQRHFLPAPEPAWDDDALGAQLGLDGHDVTRAQAVLDAVQAVVPRARPPLGPGWWGPAASTGSGRALA